MRTVLYTHDMEPITVIELRPWQVEYLGREGVVTLAVMPEDEYPEAADDQAAAVSLRTVRMTAEWFYRNGERRMLLFTRQEETAMLLECQFLPGQRRKLKEHEREAFSRGISAAFIAWRRQG